MPKTLALVRWSVEWEALEDMQTFAAQYAARRFAGELGDRARITSHELLENAVRYATAGSEVEYEVRDADFGFEIRVTNQAVDSRVALLRKRIVDLTDGNAAESYRRALRKLYDQPGEAAGASGGLGLLRVRHEANVELGIEVDAKRVTVIGSGRSSGFQSGATAGQRADDSRRSRATGKESNGKLR